MKGKYIAAIHDIAERVGDREFQYPEIRDLVPAAVTLRALRREKLLILVSQDAQRGNIWKVAPAALKARRPRVSIGDGVVWTLPHTERALLTVWQDRRRKPFQTAEFQVAFDHARISALAQKGWMERVDAKTWRVTAEGAKYASSLARQVAQTKAGVEA